MLRQLYPILLSITIALAIGVNMHPGEARNWIHQAEQWGAQVLRDSLQTTVVLADEALSNSSQAGYASTDPSGGSAANGYNSYSDPYAVPSSDPAWTYVDDGNTSTARLSAPVAPSAAYGNYPAASTGAPYTATSGTPSVGPSSASAPASGANVYPRVLADGSQPTDNMYRAQPDPVYGAGALTPSGTNPLRPSMPREAPWAAGTDGAYTSNPPQTYRPAKPAAQLGSRYPKGMWAGDYKDFRGVPESVKPTGQDAMGYLPPPDVQSTAATVNRYLPPPSQGAAAMVTPTAPRYPVPYQAQHSSQYPATNVPPIPSPQTASGATTAGAAPPAYPRQQQPIASQSPPVPTTPSMGQAPGVPTVASVPREYRPAPPATAPTAAATTAAAVPCEGAQVLAWVGSEVLLASEVLPAVHETMNAIKDIDKVPEEELEAARKALLKRYLVQFIELKLYYVDAKRNFPPEALEQFSKQLGLQFEEQEVPSRLERLKLSSRRELEEKLAKWGSSLDQEKRAFVERVIAMEWKRQSQKKKEEVTHEQLLDYYHAHIADYEHPTRVRWEHLKVSFSRHSNKAEAWQLIAGMGNAVQQGRPLAEVAKESSEGVLASGGGQRDWLTQGSLKSDVLDKALFTLPVGTMSRILEDETGFHIVRVVEREDAYRTAFEKVQTEIREKLQKEQEEAHAREFIERLREEIPVRTIFDKPTADAEAASPPK